MAIIDFGIRTSGRSVGTPEAAPEQADPSNPDRPARPASLEPEDLGFARRERMVRWMSPKQLSATAVKVLVSSFFGAYSDKREIQAGLPSSNPVSYVGEPGVEERGGVWVDYVADLGDGFGPTYSVASLLARQDLPLAHDGGPSKDTCRGRMLVMGGDQVYPVASTIEYRDRTLGPYRAALPYSPPATAPDLFAVPGNHDWYDGLTSFMRIFCREDWIGGWRTRQRRSYFAVQPRENWWLWGIDIQFDSYIDQPQFEYFENLAKASLKRGDSVVLCSAVPSWVKANEGKKPNPEAFATLDYFERKIIRGHGADVRLSLAGDAHHYARYVADDGAQRITAGGGGAYLSATHNLPKTLVLPPKERGAGKSKDPVLFELETAYPDKATSKKLRWRVLALPFRNPSMWALIGTVQLFLAWMFHLVRSSGLSSPTGMHAATFVLCLAVVWGVSGFTKSKVSWKRAVGAVHGFLHLALTVAVIEVAWSVLHRLRFEDGWFLAGFVVLVGVGGGLLGGWLLATYLLFADRWLHCNANELFAAQRNRDYKNFLRLHFDCSGGVTVYPVKVARTPREWRLNVEGGLDDPWITSDEPLEAELIEEPFTILPLEIGADLEQELAEAGSRAS